MPGIDKIEITKGITWIAVEDANLYMCCGCPADTVKHLKKSGLINRKIENGFSVETGPNAILLSDALIQNGQLSNLSEFPVLQMLYLQGMGIPGHPNYRKEKPLLIGLEDHLKSQIQYIYCGNYGLSSLEEILATGIEEEYGRKIFEIKKFFAFDNIASPEEMIDQRIIANTLVEIKDGVFIRRTSFNKYRVEYKDEYADIDMNLGVLDHYEPPFVLPYSSYPDEYFTIVHSGEGNGWDVNRPCMASVIIFRDKIYVIDAGPNILNNLNHLGISVAEIDGIFQSHVHDDHFAGLTELIKADKKFKYHTSRLVRETAQKKLSALMGFPEDSFHYVFECIDLELNEWNDIDGLKVKPVFSPHPVETNVFFFEASINGDTKSYIHLSDTVALNIFSELIDSRSGILSQSDFQTIQEAYLKTADLKKIDVGGGAIHGHYDDYKEDKSGKIIYAHTDEHNKNVPDHLQTTDFGSSDVLLKKADNKFLEKRALKFLKHYFNTLEDHDLALLLDQSLHSFSPGQTIITAEDPERRLCLVVTGIIDGHGQAQAQNGIPAGTFVGFSKRYFFGDLPRAYVAQSHVNVLLIREDIINEFIRSYSSELLVATRLKYIVFLRNLWIFEKSVSLAILNRICGAIQERRVEESYSVLSYDVTNLVILLEGEAVISCRRTHIETLRKGGCFGTSGIINRPIAKYEILLKKDSVILEVPGELIKEIPSVLWKILEIYEKRNFACTISLD